MKISTKGRYAVRILADIALHETGGFIAMKDVARRQQISKKYADQIGSQLTQAGILIGVRGHQGGYKLNRAPEQLTVLEILQVMEGSIAPVACMEGDPNRCSRCQFCLSLPVWQGLEKVMREYLGSITLQDILDRGGPQPDFSDMLE